MTRPPSAPPQLPGYRYLRHIGGGGFADVFLYEEEGLHREVAIKVLLSSHTDAAVRSQFDAESTLMAALSAHPNIVTIHAAAIAKDGRPYLVMEYCPRANLAERYKAERFTAAEATAIGVQLGGAIETAHRAGILHRDIKPANVLSTKYNSPALTDFGISVVSGTSPATVGMSVPWSPPEMLSDAPTGDSRADQYSLAATIYTLLAGRSPYQRPNGPNTAVDLAHRIQHTPLPPLGRSDIPADLERVLQRGMAKSAGARWPSVLDMARALQDVQAGQGWPVTEIAVLDEDPVAARAELAPEDDGRTRIRGFTTIHAQAPVADTGRRPADTSATPDAAGTVLRQTGAAAPASFAPAPYRSPAAVADTVLRSATPAAAVEPAEPAKRGKWVWFAGAGAAALAVAVTVVVLTGGTEPPQTVTDTGATQPSDAAAIAPVPAPEGLSGTVSNGTVTFTWTNPDPQPGDMFQWKQTHVTDAAGAQSTTATTATVDGAGACIEVLLVRDDGRFSDPADACAGATS